jgi:hypothetical protein
MVSLAGRKIESDYENPFDNIIIDIAHWLNIHLFRPMKFVPNYITTLSLVFGVVAVYAFHKQRYILASVLFLIAYILDCADGNYARMFNMVSKFGDYYDHVSDLTKFALLICAVSVHPIDTKIKIVFIVLLCILLFLSSIHLGCQEKIFNADGSDSLSVTKHFCPNHNIISFTRHFGCGTVIMYVLVFMWIMAWYKKCI